MDRSGDTNLRPTHRARVDVTGAVRDLTVRSTSDFDDEKIVAIEIGTLLSAATRVESEGQNDLSSLSSETISIVTDHTSSSLDSPEQATPTNHNSAEESGAVLDLMDNLDDIDESYMLSVFWNSGDSVGRRSDNNSAAGRTMCSYASTNSSATSMSNYTWTSSSRCRHNGAYQKRSRELRKTTVVASWVDTMHESTATLLGPLNKWSVSKGWQNEDGRKWDPSAETEIWGSLDPIFDKECHPLEEGV